MLWEAGQERLVREYRERMTEGFVQVRDGYIAGRYATGTKLRGYRPPSYARPEPKRRGLADLVRDLGGRPPSGAPVPDFTRGQGPSDALFEQVG